MDLLPFARDFIRASGITPRSKAVHMTAAFPKES